jgi:hypothetical protein
MTTLQLQYFSIILYSYKKILWDNYIQYISLLHTRLTVHSFHCL